jgi:DNA-binding MarR family transcriptional regulator
MEFNTRVRLALLSNPARGKQLREFTHGVESLKELWQAAADIRRLDFCLFLKTSDITDSGEDVVNTEYPYPDEQSISGDALKHSILWAWSRQPEHIQWQKAAEKACLEAAARMSEKYGAADDIPLVSPADQRIKLARMAVALAALVHSTDDTHEKVIVKPEHVEFIENYLNHIYDAKNCRYDVYARYAREETVLTPEERQIISAKMDQVDLEAQSEAHVLVLDLYRRNNMLRSNEIKDLTNLDTNTVNSVLRVLSQHHMIKRTKNGFQKLPKLVEYLEFA